MATEEVNLADWTGPVREQVDVLTTVATRAEGSKGIIVIDIRQDGTVDLHFTPSLTSAVVRGVLHEVAVRVPE